jgi:hypothetical protein
VNITGEITDTVEVEIDIDTDDILSEIDWSSIIDANVDIDSKVENLLEQYHGNSSPCSMGRTFEKSVWWAMTRQADHDGDYEAPSHAAEAAVRRIVQEEIRAFFLPVLTEAA